MTTTASPNPVTSAHAMLGCLVRNGIDRVFVVPGESYLGVLDALSDFPEIDVITCRHESSASFMASVDGRLTRRPGVAMVSRGPGATNASIGVHAAQQDATPLILVIGQVCKKDLRRSAFQEIDYQQMFGSIAKWVFEVTEPEQLATAAFKAIRVATSGTPGPVVLVIPEDVQQQPVDQPDWVAMDTQAVEPTAAVVTTVHQLLVDAKRPLLIAGNSLSCDRGRESLRKLAEKYRLPVAVSFRQHDLFPNSHELFVGDLGLANPPEQMAALESSDLILALGTRLGDITTQGYTFPRLPRPSQTLIHCFPDSAVVGQHFVSDIGIVSDATALADALVSANPLASVNPFSDEPRLRWASHLRQLHRRIAGWPNVNADDGVPFVDVIRELSRQAPDDLVVCLDSGTFAAPVYRHFPFVFPQRLMASQSGAMGFGTPAAIACQLRLRDQKIVCLVGDGGFMMTGNEMIIALERRLPILFIVSNNNCYGSIRIHQDREYPGRHVGTSLSNPDFAAVARAFGMQTEVVSEKSQIEGALTRGLQSKIPYFIEVQTSLHAVLPIRT